MWLPFLAAFLLAGLTATSYVELVTTHPHASGSARWVEVAFGRPVVTFLVGFVVAASATSTAAAVSRAVGGQYLATFVELPVVAVALTTIVVLSALTWVGIAESARANAVMTVVEVGGLLIVVAAGIGGAVRGAAEPSRLLDTGPVDAGAMAVLGATALAFFAYLGFEDAVHLAEEVRDPARSFPRAMFGGLAVVGVLYLGVALSVGSLVDPAALAGSGRPLLDAVEAGGLPVPGALFSAIAIVAVTNTALIALTTASRQLYGLAEQGSVPGWLGRVGRRRTPDVAIVGVAAVVSVLAASGGVRELAGTTVALLLAVFVIVNVTVLVLRRRPPAGGSAPGFRAPAAVPVVGAVGSALLLIDRLVAGGPGLLVRLGGLLGTGLVLFALARGQVRGRPPAPPHRSTGTGTGP